MHWASTEEKQCHQHTDQTVAGGVQTTDFWFECDFYMKSSHIPACLLSVGYILGSLNSRINGKMGSMNREEQHHPVLGFLGVLGWYNIIDMGHVVDTVISHPISTLGLEDLLPRLLGVLLAERPQLSSLYRICFCWEVTQPRSHSNNNWSTWDIKKIAGLLSLTQANSEGSLQLYSFLESWLSLHFGCTGPRFLLLSSSDFSFLLSQILNLSNS